MLPNQAIFERGYMLQSEVLDPYSMRPYINSRGISVVAQVIGHRPLKMNGQVVINKRGQTVMEPVLVERPFYRNALLRKMDWEQIDAVVQDIKRLPLVGIDDLRADGLVHQLDGIGVSISTYEQMTDMSGAEVGMSILSKGEKDVPAFNPVSIPVPIIWKEFAIDARSLAASGRNGGTRLDTTGTRVATIKVRETLEDILFNGSSVKSGDAAIYGYTNHPFRVTGTVGSFGGGAWSTPGNAHKTLVGMIETLRQQGHKGPYRAYISNTQNGEILNLIGDNKAETELSVIQRTIPDLKSIKPTDRLDDGEVVVVSMDPDTVDLAIGQDFTPVSWLEYGGALHEFRVLGAMVPRVKYNADETSGVAHATGA